MSENARAPHSEQLVQMLAAAWRVRGSAHVLGLTPVGCAVLDEIGRIHAGCNIEHKFRSHDIHAEVNAISHMVAAGGRQIVAIVVVAERERFTPCGACMDWIMQFCDSECPIYFQPAPGAELHSYTASQLMPLYPR
jgi:cytidine deaminase